MAFALGRLASRSSEGAKVDGGARRDRTADLVIANDALSQLSYGPAKCNDNAAVASNSRQVGAI
jgi:hypothetical protein